MTTSGSTNSRLLTPDSRSSFTYSIIAAMAVLYCSASVFAVTLRIVRCSFCFTTSAALRRRLMHQGPDLLEKPPYADDALVAEIAPLLERAEKHEVHPERVRAPLLDVGVGHDDVAARHVPDVPHDSRPVPGGGRFPRRG